MSGTRTRVLTTCFLTGLFMVCNQVLAKEAVVEEDETQTEKALRIVPLVTSTPLTGTGLGVAASYLYRLDDGSAKSQLQIGGQYSDSNSLTLFVRNNAFLRGNGIISNSAILPSEINSEFDNAEGERVEYQTRSFAVIQKLLFRVKNNFYVGGVAFYRKADYSPNNEAGEEFLFENGVTDQQNAGFGGSLSWDSRKNRYFPRNAYWVDVDLGIAPSFLGAEDSFGRLTVNARYYGPGLRDADVWAHQFFGQFASENTPDGGLPTLSGRSLLRGFPAGQFRARYLTGAQTEYRYVLEDSSFKLTAFAGVARLEGGSSGQDGRERDDDGTYWAGGLGVRYAIQRRTGVDLRLDLVTTSEQEQSIYLTLNQAF